MKKCHNYQIYGDVSHFPSMELQGMTSPWSFAVWGIDIIGEVRLKASNGHRYIIVAIDYFSKWVEAESYTTVGSRQMARFIEKNIIYRYGLPHHVIMDNGVQFRVDTEALLKECKSITDHLLIDRRQIGLWKL